MRSDLLLIYYLFYNVKKWAKRILESKSKMRMPKYISPANSLRENPPSTSLPLTKGIFLQTYRLIYDSIQMASCIVTMISFHFLFERF